MGRFARRVDVELDRTRPISFPLRAWKEFQDKFGMEPENVVIGNYDELADMLVYLLKAADPTCDLTHDDLMELIDAANATELSAAIMVVGGMPVPEDMKDYLAKQGKEIPKLYRPSS